MNSWLSSNCAAHGGWASKLRVTAHWLAVASSMVGPVAAGAVVPASFPASPAPRISLADLSLKELLDVQFDTVTTASRRSQRLWEAPASVSIVTREEIAVFGYRTLADALGSTPGVYTTDDRYYTYLGMRGFSRPGDYNSRVLLLVDGSRVNDNLYDSGWVGHESPVDVDNIERVEVIRGPSSSLYGSSAFFGTVNVISRRGGSLNGVETSAEAGSLRSYRTRTAAGYKYKSGFEFFTAASYFESRGVERLYYAEFDAPETNHGVAENLDYQRAWHLAGNAAYRGFTLSGVFNKRTRGIPTGSFASQFNDPRARTVDISGHVDLKFEHEFTPGTQLMARVGYHRYDYHGVYPYNAAEAGDPVDVLLNRDDARGDWWGTEVTLSQRISSRLTVTSGLEVRQNFRQRQLNYDATEPVTVYVDDDSGNAVRGVYGQADWSVQSNLIVSAGLRYDHYSTFGGSTNPRVGVIYQPWASTTTKVLYGRAFRAPNAYETHYLSFGQNPNPNLGPETIETYEAMIEQALSPTVKLTASGSHYQVRGLIAFDYDPVVYSFQNLDQAKSWSGDVGVEGRWRNGWFGRVSYTTQHGEDGNGIELTNSPRSLTKGHLRIPLFHQRFSAAIETQRIGSARAVQAGRVDPSWVANVTLFGRDVVKGVQLSASVYNLFDRAVGSTGFDEHRQRVLIQNGRSYRLRLTYTY